MEDFIVLEAIECDEKYTDVLLSEIADRINREVLYVVAA